ncbi:GbsR/MarR family transcriptional regulator [Alkalimonas amylolytica]|uniref:HTH-type transcriptional regulator n=1 Tax=Alkalimonas amylolytica TaxID=152573 RepID=A0A1H4CN23_ALKAM|nr:GbsR/MarR family transcriptional regulator [Alkalimonas amylolytica]SEA61452.1 DNA-binding transcriptional regulator GbsR, MarR family [Alkalimonas amylolytica]
MRMTPMIESFVCHFGEMGSRWGFNRTVGQIYALLVINQQPLCANDIGELLGISRGNVSMGLKELHSWQLVQTTHRPGDRKDYYQSRGSIWDMANRVFEERRKREIDPTLSLLRDILLDEAGNAEEAYAQERIAEIHDLLENITDWAQSLQSLSPEKLNTLMKLGSGVGKVLEFKDKLMTKKAD